MVLTLASAPASAEKAAAAQPRALPDGRYRFEHRYSEQPNMRSFPVTVEIKRSRIRVINPREVAPFPRGVIAEGRLLWHTASGQWIIGEQPGDHDAPDVGGCSAGPDVVDLLRRIYWTC